MVFERQLVTAVQPADHQGLVLKAERARETGSPRRSAVIVGPRLLGSVGHNRCCSALCAAWAELITEHQASLHQIAKGYSGEQVGGLQRSSSGGLSLKDADTGESIPVEALRLVSSMHSEAAAAQVAPEGCMRLPQTGA